MKPKILKVPMEDLVDRYTSAFASLSRRYVGRQAEIDAIKLAILCRFHVLLEGPPGVAKSALATDVFKIFDTDDQSPTVFKCLLRPQMTEDHIVGPLKMDVYKSRAELEHNIDRMLPTAHFAFLDEVFRASGPLLDVFLSILNERKFMNGSEEVKCPLITAIGTTNFVGTEPEQQAFLDRWHLRLTVKPMMSAEARLKILNMFLDDSDFTVAEPISLTELKRMQSEVRKVVIPPELLAMYEEMLYAYRTVCPSVEVSDRRYAQSIRLVQAAIFLESQGLTITPESIKAELLTAVRPAMVLSENDNSQVNGFDTSAVNIVTQYDTVKREEPKIKEIEDRVNRLFSSFDPNDSRTQNEKLLSRVNQAITALASLRPEEDFVLNRNVQRKSNLVKKLESLKAELEAAARP